MLSKSKASKKTEAQSFEDGAKLAEKMLLHYREMAAKRKKDR